MSYAARAKTTIQRHRNEGEVSIRIKPSLRRAVVEGDILKNLSKDTLQNMVGQIEQSKTISISEVMPSSNESVLVAKCTDEHDLDGLWNDMTNGTLTQRLEDDLYTISGTSKDSHDIKGKYKASIQRWEYRKCRKELEVKKFPVKDVVRDVTADDKQRPLCHPFIDDDDVIDDTGSICDFMKKDQEMVGLNERKETIGSETLPCHGDDKTRIAGLEVASEIMRPMQASQMVAVPPKEEWETKTKEFQPREKLRYVLFKARTTFHRSQTHALGRMIGESDLTVLNKNEIHIRTESLEIILQILLENPTKFSTCGVHEVRIKCPDVVGGQFEESRQKEMVYSIPAVTEVRTPVAKEILGADVAEFHDLTRSSDDDERKLKMTLSTPRISATVPMPLPRQEKAKKTLIIIPDIDQIESEGTLVGTAEAGRQKETRSSITAIKEDKDEPHLGGETSQGTTKVSTKVVKKSDEEKGEDNDGQEGESGMTEGAAAPPPGISSEQRAALEATVSDIFLPSQRRFMTLFDLRRRSWIYPPGILHTRNGNMVVIDRDENEVQVTDENNEGYARIISFHDEFTEQFQPWDVATSSDDTIFFMTDRGNRQIVVCDDNGEILTTFGEQVDMDPRGIALMGDDRVVVTDVRNNCVRMFTCDGRLVATSRAVRGDEGQFSRPHSVVINSRNQVIVTDNGNHRVQVLDSELRPVFSFGSEGSEDGELSFPQGVGVDRFDNIYVCDFGNFRIVQYDSDGDFVENRYLPVQPNDIAIENDENMPVVRIYVTDLLNYCIKVFLHFLSQIDDALGLLLLAALFEQED